MAKNWSELPTEILELIIRQLDVMHYYRFGATCKSWRSAATSKCYPLSRQFPWLMLSKHNNDTDAHSFFSLFHQKECWLRVPELHGKRCCGSSNGWLVTIDHHTLALHLLNPFSRLQIELPSPKTSPYFIRDPNGPPDDVHFMSKVVLSSDPLSTDDYVAMAIFSGMGRLAFFRPREEGKWIVIDSPIIAFNDIIYYKGQFYAVNCRGTVVMVEISPHPKLSVVARSLMYYHPCRRYLVECSGELLHVMRLRTYDDSSVDTTSEDSDWDIPAPDVNHRSDNPPYVDFHGDISSSEDSDSLSDYEYNDNRREIISNFNIKTAKFRVFKLGTSKPKWERVKSLGDCMLFLGDNGSISFSVTHFPGSKGNQIYFTHDSWEAFEDNEKGCHDLGVFNMEAGTIEPFYPAAYHSHMLPPIWITPNP